MDPMAVELTKQNGGGGGYEVKEFLNPRIILEEAAQACSFDFLDWKPAFTPRYYRHTLELVVPDSHFPGLIYTGEFNLRKNVLFPLKIPLQA